MISKHKTKAFVLEKIISMNPIEIFLFLQMNLAD